MSNISPVKLYYAASAITTNVDISTLSGLGLSFNGVAFAEPDMALLLCGQNDPSENGIVQSSSSAWGYGNLSAAANPMSPIAVLVTEGDLADTLIVSFDADSPGIPSTWEVKPPGVSADIRAAILSAVLAGSPDGPIYCKGTASTSTATPKNVLTAPYVIPVDKTATIEVTLTSRKPDLSLVSSWKMWATWKNVGGTISQEGADELIVTGAAWPGGVPRTVNPTGAEINVQVTGVAATNFDHFVRMMIDEN